MLSSAQMPGLFRVADRRAIVAQRRHTRVTIAQLSMLWVAVLAGVATQVTGNGSFGFVGVGAYIVLVTVRVYGRISHHEAIWYDNRQLAESLRSLVWRYAVGGAPFPVDRGEEADHEYSARVTQLLDDMTYAPVPEGPTDVQLITPEMRASRARSLDERRTAYGRERVLEQLQWYAARAKADGFRGARLDVLFLAASAAAVFFGLLQAFGVLGINLLGLFAVVAASFYTWQSQRRYGKQAATYAAAANQLTLVHTALGRAHTEQAWAELVDAAESGIAREHTSWRVARAQP
ncbi:DUF4231 domain-containing protein [Gaopeijia maritima]|uniref:DUF4231 domain-containing protein n=1 Tax=Gaopeijia maritima TaxID=3119007 RepID=A0ABU9E9B0_9BACT